MEKHILIGIDGGATKVKAYVVEQTNHDAFSLVGQGVERHYHQYPSFDPAFTPVDLKTQLSDLKSGNCQCRDFEYEQAQAYIQAVAEVIAALLENNNHPAIVGLGMPGLKTPDGQGIAVFANGPRIPKFGAAIESKLKQLGITLKAPIARLGSDADYCGMGEQYASQGFFRSVKNAYYLGGGTGVADALKLDDSLISFDRINDWMPKCWEMASNEGKSLEKYISARGIQELYSHSSGIDLATLDQKKIFGSTILSKAIAGDKSARKTLDIVARQLSKLLFSRITTLFMGWQKDFSWVNPDRKAPDPDHIFVGTLLDRIVIGQRIGDLLEEAKTGPLLYRPMLNYLFEEIQELNHPGINVHYLDGDSFNESIIRLSQLREAPVIGAGVAAWQAVMWRD